MIDFEYAIYRNSIWIRLDQAGSFYKKNLIRAEPIDLGDTSFILQLGKHDLPVDEVNGTNLRLLPYMLPNKILQSKIEGQNGILVTIEIQDDYLNIYRLRRPGMLGLEVVKFRDVGKVHIPPNWIVGRNSSGRLVLCPKMLFNDIDDLYLGLEGNWRYLNRLLHVCVAAFLNADPANFSPDYCAELPEGIARGLPLQYHQSFGLILQQDRADLAVGSGSYPKRIQDIPSCCFPVGRSWFIAHRKHWDLDTRISNLIEREECVLGVEILSALGWEFYALWDTSNYIRNYLARCGQNGTFASRSDNRMPSDEDDTEIGVICEIDTEGSRCITNATLKGVLFNKGASKLIVQTRKGIQMIPLSNSSQFFAPLPRNWIVINSNVSDTSHDFVFAGELCILSDLASILGK